MTSRATAHPAAKIVEEAGTQVGSVDRRGNQEPAEIRQQTRLIIVANGGRERVRKHIHSRDRAGPKQSATPTHRL